MNPKNFIFFILVLIISRTGFGISHDFLFNNKKLNNAKSQLFYLWSNYSERVFSYNHNLNLGQYNYYSGNYIQANKYFRRALQYAISDNQRGNIYFWLGRNSLIIKDAEKSAQYFAQAIKYNKNISPEFLFFYGMAMYLTERYDDALNLFLNFESQSKIANQIAELPLFIGASALGKGDYTTAEKYLKKIIREDSLKFFPLPDYLLGVNYYLNNEIENSTEHFTKVKFSSVRELQKRAHIISGTIYFNNKDITRAINEFDAIVNDTIEFNDDWKAQAYLRSGISYYKLKKTKTALLRFDSLKQKHPSSNLNEWGSYYTALINQQSGKWKKAKAEYKQLIATYPQSPLNENSRYNLGRILYQEQNFIEAIPILEDFVNTYNKSEFRKDVYFMLLQSYEKIDNDDKIKYYGEKFVKEFPYTSEVDNVHYMLGEIGFKKKNYQYARRHFLNIKQGRLYAYALKRLGDIYYDLDSLSQAVDYYNQAEKNCADSLIDEVRWKREKSYLKQGVYNTILDMYKGYLEKYPESRKAVMAQYEIGEYFLQQGDYYHAITEFDKVKEYSLFSEYSALAEMRKAYTYKMINEPYRAIESYLIIINNFKTLPFFKEAVKLLADLYFSEQSYDSAVYFYNILIQDFPKSDEAESSMVQLIEINKILNRLTDVIKLSEQFIIKYPRSLNLFKVYLYLADSYKETGKYEQAEKTLKESFNKRGKFGDGYFKLGEINYIQNKLTIAKSNFIEAHSLYLQENKKDLAALSLYQAGKCAMSLNQFEQAKELFNQCLNMTQDERLRIQCEEQIRQLSEK